ncbi:23.5 kDa heat shock protein, mitochondrial-like [Cornus florida]|uniref:23.5 kDa heat shock protein, mitochondrial-like n=1 Tax=Cornus florida TaxID=4283 RepID=UPI00289785BB|nr:23.5 kDa heat shock protein, mitochondrial-like [Cornus florida]
MKIKQSRDFQYASESAKSEKIGLDEWPGQLSEPARHEWWFTGLIERIRVQQWTEFDDDRLLQGGGHMKYIGSILFPKGQYKIYVIQAQMRNNVLKLVILKVKFEERNDVTTINV